MAILLYFIALVWCIESLEAHAGGELYTTEAFLHGRFEVRMRSVEGKGIVSSFFLYNLDLGCNGWPAQNNEIDVEMTGNKNGSVQFTTHRPHLASTTHIEPVEFNPHQEFHDYAIEWIPGRVQWFVDGKMVYSQTGPDVDPLVHPMRVMMNVWIAPYPDWVGPFDPSILPLKGQYQRVAVASYTPETGNMGTNNDFTMLWEDNFETELDRNRWIASSKYFNELTSFHPEHVYLAERGTVNIYLGNRLPTKNVKVTFRIDASTANLDQNDIINVAGGFNNWCGNCHPMSNRGGGIWERKIELPSGNHEYQFVVNNWGGQISAPPAGSSCDFNPCDEYNNYGFLLNSFTEEWVTPIHCWNSCCSN